jgi:phage-related protein
MSTNVGAVDFELLLNSNPFNKGLKNATNTIKSSGIENSLRKIGKLAIAAFSVKAIVNFGKECINLGSDLTEVQNVVDVTFGSLNTEVNKFAENAITQFGLGQTVAKKYVGTFGAMAKAFNFSNKEALAMSETLTGLTGDVASFYNLSSDEAYTKLKSVFTGETETLKDLGVVMTQNALDQYALANGYGKTTSKMSEQEKVALRYKFVLDKLNIANGDFIRTSDSWANQTRVLSLRFNELKATLGQGFINIFTPIVKGINMVLSKLQVLANAFKSFTEMIFGNAGGDDSTSTVSDLASDASKASDAVSGIGDSAKKSAKDLKSLASFDTAQILKKDDSDSSSSGSGSGGIDTSELGNLTNSAMQQANAQMDNFIKKSKELFSIFKEGFDDAFENTNFDGIIDSCERIKTALTEIFTDSDINEYAAEWVDTVLYNMGRMTGSVASVGVTIADNLLGGFANFLEQNEEDIQEHIMNIFSISSESWDLLGDISETFADIFAVFRGPEAKQCTADIIAIFTDGILGVYEIVGKFTNDILYIISQPFIENKDLIKNALEGLLQPISSVLETIKQGVQDTFSKFWEVYDTYIRPAVENIKDGFSSILETVLNVWNENIKPILDEWASRFDSLWKEHLQPMVNNFLEFFGKLINGISTLWNTWLVPIINWIVANVIPVLGPIFETIGNLFMDVFGVISDILNGVWQVLGGLIDFIVGVFTGDWEKAWNGIESIFSGIWTMIKGILEGIWNAITDIIKGAIDSMKNYIQTVMNSIKSIWENIWNGIKNFASNIWNGIKGIFSGVGSWFSNIFQQAYNGITRIFSNIGNFFSGVWNRIKNTFSNLGTSIGNAISSAVKSGINGVISLIERTINRAISLINGGIDLINLIPNVNVGKISSLNLPRLAQGGYVKANTPQLAMIGDNRHQGEVVAPEDKLIALYKKANQEMGLGNNAKVIELLEKIIQILMSLSFDFNLYIDSYELNKRLEKIKNKNRFATNGG